MIGMVISGGQTGADQAGLGHGENHSSTHAKILTFSGKHYKLKYPIKGGDTMPKGGKGEKFGNGLAPMTTTSQTKTGKGKSGQSEHK
jgi:hypothetical protein